jgi:hypothetical protein
MPTVDESPGDQKYGPKKPDGRFLLEYELGHLLIAFHMLTVCILFMMIILWVVIGTVVYIVNHANISARSIDLLFVSRQLCHQENLLRYYSQAILPESPI